MSRTRSRAIATRDGARDSKQLVAETDDLIQRNRRLLLEFDRRHDEARRNLDDVRYLLERARGALRVDVRPHARLLTAIRSLTTAARVRRDRTLGTTRQPSAAARSRRAP